MMLPIIKEKLLIIKLVVYFSQMPFIKLKKFHFISTLMKEEVLENYGWLMLFLCLLII